MFDPRPVLQKGDNIPGVDLADEGDLLDLPTDERNAHIQAEASSLSLKEVLGLATNSITDLLSALQSLPAEALDDPS